MLTPELVNGVGDYIAKCQTYEGGFSAVIGTEAHAGYAYCGIASLAILNEIDKINLEQLENWACGCQLAFEGGFSGRTNKLVDSCYSHWQGAIPIICELHRSKAFDKVFLYYYK